MGNAPKAMLPRHRPANRTACAVQASDSDDSAARTVRLVDGCLLDIARDASADVAIGAIAERQRGGLDRSQLLAAGVSSAAVERRVRRGRLDRIHNGVYALPHTSDIPLGEEVAALLACGEDAVLSHHSAATLWGLRPGRARPIHVTIPVGRSGPKPSAVKLHRSRTLTPADVRILHGLPVTSPARALLDVAAALPDRDVERLLSEAVYARRLVTLQEIRALLRRVGNHPGRRRLARVVAYHTGDTRTDSLPEETMFELIRDAGLPEPRLRAHVLDYRLDLYWPELKLAVEIDAYGTHGSPERFESDRRKDSRLFAEMGITVIRITRATIKHRPLEALGLVARVVGQQQAAVRSSRSRSR